MLYTETPLRDAYVVDLEQHADERGFFARVFCEHDGDADAAEQEEPRDRNERVVDHEQGQGEREQENDPEQTAAGEGAH